MRVKSLAAGSASEACIRAVYSRDGVSPSEHGRALGQLASVPDMRVVDLDRALSDVVPTGMTRDGEFLFSRMTEVTLWATCAAKGRMVLDVASGVGHGAVAIVRQGAYVVGADPSARMAVMAEAFACSSLKKGEGRPAWVRGWADALPFENGAFDATFCSGTMDHFDDPEAAIAEMARVTKRDGRVVLAISNFESLACRITRAVDRFREDWLGLTPIRKRRGYDMPSDHFTRYEVDLMTEQAGRHVDVETIQGISIGWGLHGWATLVGRLPKPLANLLLRGLDAIARQWPTLSDVVIIVGRPRLDRSIIS